MPKKKRTMQKDLEAKKAIWKPDVLQAKQQEFAKRLQVGNLRNVAEKLAAEELASQDILERMGAILETLKNPRHRHSREDRAEFVAPGKFDMTTIDPSLQQNRRQKEAQEVIGSI